MIDCGVATRFPTSNVRYRRLFHVFVFFLMVYPLSGCLAGRNLMAFRQKDPMAGAPRLSTSEQLQLEDVVAHVNENTHRIHSWRANNIRIQANNYTLSGSLAVEQGRHVRLVVNSPLGNEVDLGSNDDRFWIWSRRMEPAFVTCKHENIEVARQSLGIPFEPDWLMQALGVDPLPSSGVTMERDPKSQQVRLIQQHVSVHGVPIRRVMVVDLKKGSGIVTEHGLYDYHAQPIAIAKLGKHQLDKASGAVVPKQISLNWPQNQMHLTMDLGKIDVNPSSFSAHLWEMPDMKGADVVNLDDNLPSRAGISRISLRSDDDDSPVEMDNSSLHDRDEEDQEAETSHFSRVREEYSDSESSSSSSDDWSE